MFASTLSGGTRSKPGRKTHPGSKTLIGFAEIDQAATHLFRPARNCHCTCALPPLWHSGGLPAASPSPASRPTRQPSAKCTCRALGLKSAPDDTIRQRHLPTTPGPALLIRVASDSRAKAPVGIRCKYSLISFPLCSRFSPRTPHFLSRPAASICCERRTDALAGTYKPPAAARGKSKPSDRLASHLSSLTAWPPERRRHWRDVK